jgi:C4-dicarboxylate-specific signal transduction histidine kinase
MLVNVGERSRAEAARAALNASLEQRVAERTQELALAKHRAETADRGKSELMARVSHELPCWTEWYSLSSRKLRSGSALHTRTNSSPDLASTACDLLA